MRRRTVTAPVALAATLAFVLGGCSSDSELDSTSDSFDLRHDDPPGFTACRDVGLAGLTDDQTEKDEHLSSAAASAASAQTPGLRDTVSPPVDEERLETVAPDDEEYTVDEAELRTACEEAGFDFDLVEDDES